MADDSKYDDSDSTYPKPSNWSAGGQDFYVQTHSRDDEDFAMEARQSGLHQAPPE